MDRPSITSPLSDAQALGAGLVPPGVFVRGDEALRVTSFNSAAGVTLAIEGLQYLAGRGPQWFGDRHVPNTDRTSATTLVRLGEGWLSQVHVRASGGTPRRGQCFVIVELVRGSTNGNVTALGVLAQGYVTDTQRRGYPASPLELSTEGPGVIRSITGSNPAAGAEISETVPTNARWRLISALFTLVTSAAVANRLPAIVIDDGAANLIASISPANIAAGLTTTITAGAFGQLSATAGAVVTLALPPDLMLMGGYRIRTSTVLIQAGDDYSAPQLNVEEWIED